jgi:hypothetical protein
MALEQPGPWPVPHWHVTRDHFPNAKTGKLIRTFKALKEAHHYVWQYPLRARDVYHERLSRTCFDDRQEPVFIESEFNGRHCRARICNKKDCFDGYGNEKWD